LLKRIPALFFTPLVVLASAHELYLRNQEELHQTISALYPFWVAGLAAILVGAFLQGNDRRAIPRALLWAFHATGFAFMLWAFLRWLPLASHLTLWVLDTGEGAALFAAACLAATVATARRLRLRSVEPALAALALVLGAREAAAFAARLDRTTPPSVRDIPRAFGTGGDPRLPNVYHLLVDAFPRDLFEASLPPEARQAFAGFVRVDLASPLRHTMQVLPWILAGQWTGDARTRLHRTLTGESSLFGDFRRAGYRSVGFVPNYLYRSNPPALDVSVFLDESVYLDGRDTIRLKAMHSALFRRLWLYSVLPTALTRRLAEANRFGLDAGMLRSVETLRVSALAQPVVSKLGMERFLEVEPYLPAHGRYTFVHLLLPHLPYVLRSDCTDGGVLSPTDLKQQTDCTLRLVVRFLDTLRSLGRLDGSVILIHGDHGSEEVLRNGRLVPDRSAELRTLILAKPVGARGPLREAHQTATVVDIAPTLLALAGVPCDRALDGRVLEEVRP
jgi:hypothetical protein